MRVLKALDQVGLEQESLDKIGTLKTRLTSRPWVAPLPEDSRDFWHTRAVIGHGAARAVAQRAKVARHTLRRPRAPPNGAGCAALPGHRTVGRLGFSGLPLD